MGAFGLLDDHHHARVPHDLMVEANLRVSVWQFHGEGLLIDGTATELAFEGAQGAIGDPMGEPRPILTVEIRREGPNVTINGTCVALAWDAPMEGVERPWFLCPSCGRRCRHLYLRVSIACRRCLRLDYASRHLRRQTPGVGRVERLRRKLGDCEARPFAPLPVRVRRGRARAYHDALVAAILDQEQALLGHLQTVNHDLERRIRVRKERGKW